MLPDPVRAICGAFLEVAPPGLVTGSYLRCVTDFTAYVVASGVGQG